MLPRHMNATHSIKSVWTLIFKHTFKSNHLIAPVSQVTFYIIRSRCCWLKIWQPKSIWLADLTSTATDYLAQNLSWKATSLTCNLNFSKNQSLAWFIPTHDGSENNQPNPESQLYLLSKSMPVKAPPFALLSVDSLACWPQYYSEQEPIFT